jgi:hypothetical protein
VSHASDSIEAVAIAFVVALVIAAAPLAAAVAWLAWRPEPPPEVTIPRAVVRRG